MSPPPVLSKSEMQGVLTQWQSSRGERGASKIPALITTAETMRELLRQYRESHKVLFDCDECICALCQMAAEYVK